MRANEFITEAVKQPTGLANRAIVGEVNSPDKPKEAKKHHEKTSQNPRQNDQGLLLMFLSQSTNHRLYRRTFILQK